MKRAGVFSGSKASATNQGAAGNFPAVVRSPTHAGGHPIKGGGGQAGRFGVDRPAAAVHIALEIVEDPRVGISAKIADLVSVGKRFPAIFGGIVGLVKPGKRSSGGAFADSLFEIALANLSS